ncbi:MAG: hypothetical protein COB61_004110 [Thiotrichales bacterium]|nr:hypothetical protein [Thiotrichales bacterium]
MSQHENVSLSDKEREWVEAVAQERDITFEEAAAQLASEGLARRVNRKTRRTPSSNVKKFKR